MSKTSFEKAFEIRNLYFGRYNNGQLHLVVTDSNRGVTDQGIVYDAGLISQYTPEPKRQFRGAVVRKVRMPPAASIAGAGQTLAPQAGQPDETGAIPAQTGQGDCNQHGLLGQSQFSAPALQSKLEEELQAPHAPDAPMYLKVNAIPLNFSVVLGKGLEPLSLSAQDP